MPFRLDQSFYCRDVLTVAPALIGATLVRSNHGNVVHYAITEVEAYLGEEDLASHARFGRTTRNAVMYDQGGRVYVYLIYGMHWMLNIVTGRENQAQALLIRGIAGYTGPGILTKALSIDRSFYGEDLVTSDRIWVEEATSPPRIMQTPRIGIDYAGEPWKSHHWRFTSAPSLQR